jgi:phosphoglycolate phosphatase
MKPPSFDAVLFDFDGTLIDSYDAIAASVNYIRGVHGQGPLSVEEVKRHVGRGAGYLLSQTVPGSDVALDIELYREHHPTVMFDLTRLLPGAREALTGLHRAGRKIGLCSNKPRVFSPRLLDHLGIADCFDVVLGPEDVARPKPAPDLVITAMERMRVAPPQVLYVGDMTVDIETARAAGVAVWIVPTGSDELPTLEAARPDRLMRRLDELLELVR